MSKEWPATCRRKDSHFGPFISGMHMVHVETQIKTFHTFDSFASLFVKEINFAIFNLFSILIFLLLRDHLKLLNREPLFSWKVSFMHVDHIRIMIKKAVLLFKRMPLKVEVTLIYLIMIPEETDVFWRLYDRLDATLTNLSNLQSLQEIKRKVMIKEVVTRESVDTYRDFACGHYLLTRGFTLFLSFFLRWPCRERNYPGILSTNPATPSSVGPGANIIIALTVLHERERKRRGAGPAWSQTIQRRFLSYWRCFRKDEEKESEGEDGERERWRLDQYKDPPDGSTRFFLLCICMCLYMCCLLSFPALPSHRLLSSLPSSSSSSSSLSIFPFIAYGTSIARIGISFAIIDLFMKSDKRFSVKLKKKI